MPSFATQCEAGVPQVVDLHDPTPIEDKQTEQLDQDYLRGEHNWCTDTQFLTGKIYESAVWPAKMEHQTQVRT